MAADNELYDKKPNILSIWSDVKQSIHHPLSIYLDYDGTLTPIVSNPDDAQVNSSMRNTIDELSKKYTTSIITGRRIDAINKFLQLPNLYYGASHGFDVYKPELVSLHAPAEHYLDILGKFRDTMRAAVSNVKGSLVEDCKYSISIHYRNVSTPADIEYISNSVDSVLQQCNESSELKLQKHGGKCVWEIKPSMSWNKGYAVDYLINLLYGSNNSTGSMIPVYIGDDVTDEDAFEVLKKYKNSITVFVVNNTPSRATHAKYTVQDQDQVQKLLQNFIQL